MLEIGLRNSLLHLLCAADVAAAAAATAAAAAAAAAAWALLLLKKVNIINLFVVHSTQASQQKVPAPMAANFFSTLSSALCFSSRLALYFSLQSPDY